MGCFSFLCKECGEPVLSNSFRGQKVKLFLLKDGEVVQDMEGEYDSYGRVFTEDRSDSIDWDNPFPDKPTDRPWSHVCDLMFDDDKSNGIAAIHSKCLNGSTPTTRSENDPNQGWGEEGELMGDCSQHTEFG